MNEDKMDHFRDCVVLLHSIQMIANFVPSI